MLEVYFNRFMCFPTSFIYYGPWYACRNRISNAAEAAFGIRIDPEKFFCSNQFLPKLTSPCPCCFCLKNSPGTAPQQQPKQPPNSPLFCRNLLTVFTVIELLFCRFLAAVSAQNYHSKAAPNQSQISPLCYQKKLDQN